MKPKIHINLDPNEQRRDFRLEPVPLDKLRAAVEGEKVEVVNISASGVAFRTQRAYTPGIELQLVLAFVLEQAKHRLALKLELLRIAEGTCRGRFIFETHLDEKLLTRFIQHMQTAQIRAQRLGICDNNE